MRDFKCSVCGYTYDESKGITEKEIEPGIKWDDIPDDFICPLCGAPKSVFEEELEGEEYIPEELNIEQEEDLRELSNGELSALFSNLAKGCEKQKLTEEMDLFNKLSDYYKRKTYVKIENGFNDIKALLQNDLKESYLASNKVSALNSDRGALRALTWSEKVSKMLKTLLERYSKENDAMLKNTRIYVCDICGFIYIGDKLPDVCPICKVPNFKMTQIGRR